MKDTKVIPFPNKQPFRAFLGELQEAYDEDLLLDFVLIYRKKYQDTEKREGFSSRIDHYWFGKDSTLYTLGLIEVMRDTVLKYMERKCAEYEEEE